MERDSKNPRALSSGGLVLLQFFIGAASGVLAADEAARKTPPKVTYDDHLVPVLRQRCFSCHNPDKKRGGLVLNTYPSLMEGGSSGEVIAPGDPDASRLFLLVAHQETPHMPPEQEKLPEKELEVIRRWIAGGALENSGSKAPVMKKPALDLALGAVPGDRPAGPPPMPATLSLEPVVCPPRPNSIVSLAASPWAPLVAIGQPRQVLLYRTDTLELAGILPFPEGDPLDLKFSRNASLLLAGGGRGATSGRSVLWRVADGERLLVVGDEFDVVLGTDITADQRFIALGGPGKLVRVYSTADGALLHEIKKHTNWVHEVEFSPDCVLLASGDRNGGLFVWETLTAREYVELRGHGGAVTDVSWRADSNVLASASEDGTIRLWEMENGGQIKRWGAHGGGVLAVEYARDGRLVSCGRDRVVKVWDSNGKQLRKFEAFSDLALQAAFDHEATRVIGGDWTGEVRVWNAADGTLLGRLPATPPAIDARLDLARREHATQEEAFERLTVEAREATAASAKLSGELANVEKTVAQATARAGDAGARLEQAKERAGKASAELEVALKTLAEKEDAYRALEGGSTEDARKNAKAQLNAAQETAARLAAEVKEAVDGRVAAQRDEGEAREVLVESTRRLETLAPMAEKATALATATAERLEKASHLHGMAEATLARWTAARNLHLEREKLPALEAEKARLEALAFELQGKLDTALAELAGVDEPAAAGAGSLGSVLKTISELAAEMAAQAKAPSQTATEALDAARRVAGEAASSKKPAALEEAAEKLLAVESSAEQLAEFARLSRKKWGELQRAASRAAGKAGEAARLIKAQQEAIVSLEEKAASCRAAISTTVATIEAVRAEMARWQAVHDEAAARAREAGDKK